MSEQLLLPAPYGYASGYSVSLLAEEGFNADETLSAVMRFGCPFHIARKAISCLHHSGRYDCVMSPFAFEEGLGSGALPTKLSAAGVTLELRERPDVNNPGREALRIRQFGTKKYPVFKGIENLPRSLDEINRSSLVQYVK